MLRSSARRPSMAAAGLAQRADRDNRLGPWRTRDPYVRNGKVLTPCQKKQCGLCELYFRPDNLPGVATLKSVLAVKARWGVKGVQEKLNKWEVREPVHGARWSGAARRTDQDQIGPTVSGRAPRRLGGLVHISGLGQRIRGAHDRFELHVQPTAQRNSPEACARLCHSGG